MSCWWVRGWAIRLQGNRTPCLSRLSLSKKPKLQHQSAQALGRWAPSLPSSFAAARQAEYKLGSPKACSVCELSTCVPNLQANSHEALGEFINTICSKSLYTERDTEANYKRVQMPRFSHKADLYTCKGKTSQKQAYCNPSKEETENGNVCVL